MKLNQKKCLGKLVEVMHIIIYYALIIVPFVTNKMSLLALCLLGHATIIFLWYHTGDCILTPIENWLLGKKNIKHEKTGNVSNVFIFTKKMTRLSDKVLTTIFLYLPIVMIYIISFKMYILCRC